MMISIWEWIVQHAGLLGLLAALITIVTAIVTAFLSPIRWAWRISSRLRRWPRRKHREAARITHAIELERLRFAREQEDILREATASAAAMPLGAHRPRTVLSLAETALRGMVERSIALRREMITQVPELGLAENLDRLAKEIETWVDARQRPILVDIAQAGGIPSRGMTGTPSITQLVQRLGETAVVAKAWARRELQIIKAENRLNA